MTETFWRHGQTDRQAHTTRDREAQGVVFCLFGLSSSLMSFVACSMHHFMVLIYVLKSVVNPCSLKEGILPSCITQVSSDGGNASAAAGRDVKGAGLQYPTVVFFFLCIDVKIDVYFNQVTEIGALRKISEVKSIIPFLGLEEG